MPELEWTIEHTDLCDSDGWMYASNFPQLSNTSDQLGIASTCTSTASKTTFVRRRKYVAPVVSLVFGGEPQLWDGAEVVQDTCVLWRAVERNTTLENALMDVLSSDDV